MWFVVFPITRLLGSSFIDLLVLKILKLKTETIINIYIWNYYIYYFCRSYSKNSIGFIDWTSFVIYIPAALGTLEGWNFQVPSATWTWIWHAGYPMTGDGWETFRNAETKWPTRPQNECAYFWTKGQGTLHELKERLWLHDKDLELRYLCLDFCS